MSDRSIKSAERTLAIFELFSVRQEMLTVGDVSKSLGIPQPSVSMLLKNLTNMGYLEYDAPQRRYAPTLRVMLLNSWLLDRYEGTAKFVPILKSLLLELQETVYRSLCVPHRHRRQEFDVEVIEGLEIISF